MDLPKGAFLCLKGYTSCVRVLKSASFVKKPHSVKMTAKRVSILNEYTALTVYRRVVVKAHDFHFVIVHHGYFSGVIASGQAS